MNRNVLREKAWKYFDPVSHALGNERVEDKAHGFIEGYQQAIEDVKNILKEAGDLGDGDYVRDAVSELPGSDSL